MEGFSSFHQWRSFGCSACGYAFKAPVHCGDRFCEVCNGTRQRTVRAKMEAIVESVHLEAGERFRMLTLSIANCPDLKKQAKDLVASFRRLRQRAYWRNKVSGGCFVLEVKGEPDNWHIHIHAIIAAKYMSFKHLLKLWRKVSGGRGCHIKTINENIAIHYVTKYISKTTLNDNSRIEASEALKGTRLFNPFGSWFDISRQVKRVKFVCPRCGAVSWYMSNQMVDEENNIFLSAQSEHDLERWAIAESGRRCSIPA